MEEGEPPLPLPLGVPELPARWRAHYAEIAYSAEILHAFLPTETSPPGTGESNEAARADFYLGTYAKLAAKLRAFDEDCHSVWLVRTAEDFAQVTAAAQRVLQAPFSPRQLDTLVHVGRQLESPAEVTHRLIQARQPELIGAWRSWLRMTPGEHEGVRSLAEDCQTIARVLAEVLR